MLFLMLVLMNCLAEYLFHKMMLAMDVLDKKDRFYHNVCAALRIIWIYLCSFSDIPMPIMLIGLFLLLFLNVLPYPKRRLLMNNFTMIIYLIYISVLMAVIGCAGVIGVDVDYMVQDPITRIIVMDISLMVFNMICFLLLRYSPEFLWREDYDRFKVIIYTWFLLICAVYHLLDTVILMLYPTSRVNYLLLVSGDFLIVILMLNFFNCNYVFAKSEEARKAYEESEILIAQQYFKKEKLKKLSEMDSLTNTYNRREISSIMQENIQKGHKIACVFIDLDGLKRINDKYGHTYGDLMLKCFANACTELLQENGYLARIGGDEFLLIFLDQETSFIETRIKELQLKLLEPIDEKDKIYFSYGISYDEKSVEQYITLADQRMYACKHRKQCGDI